MKLACAKGHTWKAVPGSPVCFECPECKRTSLSSGRAVRKPLVGGLPPESVRTLGQLKALAALQGGAVVAVDVASAWPRRRSAVGGAGGAGGGGGGARRPRKRQGRPSPGCADWHRTA